MYAISKNLVTYLTNVLHESKVAAARNASAWSGACFFTPLFGAFMADTYWGRYWTIVIFLPVYILGLLVLAVSTWLPTTILPSSSYGGGDQVHRVAVYIGLYLAALGTGGVKPNTSAFGADQFDSADPVELAKKGSFFNWYFFMINTGSLLSSTVLVWVQDNVGWGISFAIPVLVMASFLAVFVAGSRVYRFRPLGVSPLTSLSQVVVASVRKWHLQLPDDSSLLYEEPTSSTVPSWASSEAAGHKIKHTDQFRFFDKAAVVPPPSSSSKGVPAPVSPWRLCTVTQVEELKMLLRMSPIWLSLVLFFSVSSQMTTTLLEQGMAMDNHVGGFVIPPASLSTFHVIAVLTCIPAYDAVLVPLARRVTGIRDKEGISQLQRIGIGLAMSVLIMAYSALIEMRRLAVARRASASGGLKEDRMSILWQVPVHFAHGASDVFATIGKQEFFYNQSPRAMRSLCTAFGLLGIAAGHYVSSLLLAIIPSGWIPDNLDDGHLDYFFWMMAALLLLNLAQFVYYAMRYRGNTDSDS